MKILNNFPREVVVEGQEFSGATASSAGSKGFVPAPSAGDQDKVLLGDGTWGDAPDGGHQIVDESGSLLTQRDKLQFIGGCTVTDDSINGKTVVEINVGTKIVQKPTISGNSFTYNGSAQGPTITWATGMSDNCIITNATKTDAGSYTLTIALKNSTSMVWSDMTTADITYNYTIAKASLTVPTVTDTSKTYNGSAQSPTITGFDSDTMTKSGDSATDAGDYTVSFGLADSNNYEYSSATISFAWSIARATSAITVSSNSITLDFDHLTATVTVGNDLGRTLGVSTSDNTVATASISGSTVTISNVNENSGTATITVSAAQSTNYNASSVSISVSCDFLAIVTFANGTDAEIKAMLDAYYADNITWAEMGWAVGDTRTIHLNEMTAPNPNSSSTWAAQDITVVIVAHDHHDLATPINGHSKACITVQTRECMNNNTAAYGQVGHICVNGDGSFDMSFTPWKTLYMRTYLNSTVLGSIPTGDFKDSIKPISHYVHTTHNAAADELVTDTLFLPSYPEIFGTASYQFYIHTTHTEGTQWEYYETEANRIKYGNNNGVANSTAQIWFEGSPVSRYTTDGYFWGALLWTGEANFSSGRSADSSALAPAWCM